MKRVIDAWSIHQGPTYVQEFQDSAESAEEPLKSGLIS
jgi:hypothetical protein